MDTVLQGSRELGEAHGLQGHLPSLGVCGAGMELAVGLCPHRPCFIPSPCNQEKLLGSEPPHPPGNVEATS